MFFVCVLLNTAALQFPPVWCSSERLTCWFVQEISQQAAHDGLVTDDQHILLPLQFHDDRLQALHQVLVGLSQINHMD